MIAANLGQIERHGGGMRDDDRTDLPGWLGLRRVPDFTKARWLGPVVFVSAVLLVGGLFGLAVSAAFSLLVQGGEAEGSAGSLGRGAVIVALISAPFVIWRSVVAQKTVNVTEQGHITDRINTAVQGLGAEKTVKRDGDEYSQPNLEVRIGAIYALERIAQDSDRDHVQIMEILCAYIRQNAPGPIVDDWPELEIKDSENKGPLEADWEERLKTFHDAQDAAKAKLKPREDIQAALTVIGRRSAKQRRLEAGRGVEAPFPFDTPCPEYNAPDENHDRAELEAFLEKLDAWKGGLRDYAGYCLDLRDADLRGADLSGADLKGARLTGTYLQGADLRKVQLQGAVLRQARMQGADLEVARLQGADLKVIRLQGAVLNAARLQGAGLTGSQLQGADLFWLHLQGARLMGAHLQGSDLTAARLEGARLWEAELQGADLMGAQLQGADLAGARMDEDTDLAAASLQGAAARSINYASIPQIAAHVEGIFGDKSVTLPGGHGPGHEDWPAHWPTCKLDGGDFYEQWRKWQADPEGYRRPDPPEPEDTA